MENGASFTAFQDKIFASLMSSTKSMARLAAEDLTFNRSLDPSFAASLDKCNKTILDIANALLRNSATGKELNNEPLGDADDVETNWSNIVEVVDSLLEKAVSFSQLLSLAQAH